MSIGDAVKVGIKVAGVLGTVGSAAIGAREVAKLGEAAGLPSPVGVLKNAGNFVADVAGLPSQVRFGASHGSPARALGAATSVGDAPALPNAPPLLVVCPECQGDVRLEGVAGAVALIQCDKHRKAAADASAYAEGMTLGWVEAHGFEVGAASPESQCAKYKPNMASYHTSTGFRAAAYLAALHSWQQCIIDTMTAAEKDAKQKAAQSAAIDAAKKAQKSHDSKAQEKASKMLLAQQAKAYEKQIADLNAAQAAKATSENQAQIDALTAQKATAEKLLADMQSSQKDAQKDAALQAKLDALQSQLVSAGTKPGGIDEMLKLMMLQQLMPRPMAQQTAPEQAAMFAQQQPAMAIPWDQATDQAYFAEQSMSPTYMDPGYAYEFAGTEQSEAERFSDKTPLDPEVAQELGLSGVETTGDANMLIGFRIAGWDIGEMLADWNGESLPASSCGVGSCGIQR